MGVPTVFAGVLLYFVLFKVGNTLEVIEQGEKERTAIIAAMQDTLVSALDKQADRFERAIESNIKANEKMSEVAHLERLRLLEKLGEKP